MVNVFNKITYRKYIAHSFFHKFAESLFFVFGALLLYEKSSSIMAVLVYGLIIKTTSLLFRTIGLKIYFKSIKKFGILNILGFGAFLTAIAWGGIFFISQSTRNFLFFFFGLAIIQSLGNAFFVNISSAIKRQEIGLSDYPGKFSAKLSIVNTLATIAAAFTGFFLGIGNNFLFSFIAGGLFQVISIIPLRGVKLPEMKATSFFKCIKKLSVPAFLANINIEHELKVTALPLIIFLSFTSLEISIWISTLVAVGTAIISYISGKLRDGKKTWLTKSAFIISIAGWICYGFVAQEISFIILGIILGMSREILEVGRESRLSREVSNTKNPLESTIGIEIARTFGMFVSFLLLIIVYLITETIPQIILVLGAIFIIPKAIYAIGKIAKRNS